MTESQSIFEAIPAELPEELVETILRCRGARVERIVSRGHSSPPGFWHDQKEREWVMLLSGAAELSFEGTDARVRLGPGDHVDIAAHRRHRVEWTDPDRDTVWLAVHYT